MSKNSSSSSDASYLSCVKCLLPWSSFATCASAASVVPAAIDAPVSSCLRRAVQRDAAAMQLCAVAVLQRKTASAKAARRRSKPAAFAMVKKPAWKDAAADDSDDAVVGGGFGAPQSRPSPMKQATDADRMQKARLKECPATAARRRSKNAAAMEHKRTADAAEWRSPQSRLSPMKKATDADRMQKACE